MRGSVAISSEWPPAFAVSEHDRDFSEFVDSVVGAVRVRQSLGRHLPVLLMPGTLAGDEPADLLSTALAERFRLVALDPAPRFQPRPFADLESSDGALAEADLAIEVWERLGFDDPVVVGRGAGMSGAIMAAASWPAARGLILMGGEDVVHCCRGERTALGPEHPIDTELRTLTETSLPMLIVSRTGETLMDTLGVAGTSFEASVDRFLSAIDDGGAPREWFNLCG